MARFVKTSLNAATQVITWTFPGTSLESVSLDVTKVSTANRTRAVIHGLVQRCSDNAASEKTAVGKRNAIALMAAFYEEGGAEWDRKRTAAQPKPFDFGAVILALATVKFAGDIDRANKAAEAVATKRNISRDEALKLFAQDEAIAAEMARRAAAAAGSAETADGLLDEIEGMDEVAGEEEPTK